MRQLREKINSYSLLSFLIISSAFATLFGILFYLYYRLRWFPAAEEVVEMEIPVPQSFPHPISAEDLVGEKEIQLTGAGIGSLYHRRYRLDLRGPGLDAEQLMDEIKANLPTFFPPFLNRVEKIKGEPGQMAVGDEYHIHLFGPWDAPVRVIDETPTSFTFVTLEDHLEAGEIEFRLKEPEDDAGVDLRFEIASWARNRDRLVTLFYSGLGIARFLQRNMWTYFCTRVCEESGAEMTEPIRVLTQKSPFRGEVIPDETKPWQRYGWELQQMKRRGVNFDLEKRHEYTTEHGWNVDEYRAKLPTEAPGKPLPGGPWEIARDILANYEFPDPGIITGIYVPDEPLENRTILLEARFLGMTFHFGTRIGAVIDEVRAVEERGEAQVWGFRYHTLQGHIEQGEMTFTVWKFLKSGVVEFHIDAYSRAAASGNPFFRLGWRLFGRYLQRKYARRALERVQRMVLERMEVAPAAEEALDKS